jgi:hypothetical protein
VKAQKMVGIKATHQVQQGKKKRNYVPLIERLKCDFVEWSLSFEAL